MQHVADLMTVAPLVTIEPETTIGDALQLMHARSVSHLLVTAEERLVAVLCACELERADARSAVATFLPRARLITTTPDATAWVAAGTMLEHGIHCLPVTHDGRLAGVLTASDLRRAGLLGQSVGRCTACGSDDHVRCRHGVAEVGFCLECTRRSEPPEWNDDVGGSG